MSMSADEQAIRDVISRWMKASQAGDVETVLGLMTDDVIFMTPGREPFDKKAFASTSRQMAGVKMEGTSDPVEIRVLGDWAWVRNHITVKITPPGGNPTTRSGYTLTLFARQPDGRWLLARDANLLT
jgi:uncharacterized protein (TIGR02246 family)